MSRFQTIREECCAANVKLLATGLVDLTFGNVSVLDPDAGVFAIKPSGIPYDALTPAEMVIVDLDGKAIQSGLRPSSDTPTHRRLFLAFPDIRSVVHTHSRYAVSFAQAGREIPLLGTTHADYFHGNVPITRALSDAEIQGDYEWETGNVIIEKFAGLNPNEVPAVLVRNHGPFAWGTSAGKAVENARALELVANMANQSLALDPLAEPPSRALIDKHFFRKHGAGSYYGQAGA